MSELSPEEVRDHRAVEHRQVSLPYTGPHAVFTEAELRAIRRRIELWIGYDTTLASALRKIDKALDSFPDFHLPLGITP